MIQQLAEQLVSMGQILLALDTGVGLLVAVGFSMSLLGVAIWTPAVAIGFITATLTVVGMLLGRKIGTIWGGRVEVLGGFILIGIGLKILLQSQ